MDDEASGKVSDRAIAANSASQIKESNELATSANPTNTEPAFSFDNKVFDSPIMLMAAGEPMNAGHSYPSPAIFDVDNDGDDEMVLGEIMGSVSYCENKNGSDGDPVWGEVMPVAMADGEALKLNNW